MRSSTIWPSNKCTVRSPAGQLARQMFRPMSHTHSLQSFRDKRFTVTGAHAGIGERQFDILKNAEIADQIETLENKSDFAIANARALSKRKISDFVTFQRIASI